MSLIRKTFSDSLIYGSGLILSKGISVFLLPFYTRVFELETYGFLVLILMIMPFTTTVLPLEISQATSVFMTDHPEDAPSYISTSFLFTVLMNIIFIPTGFFILKIMNIIPSFITLTTQVLIIVSLFITSIYYFYQNLIRWQQKSKLYNKSFMISSVLEISSIFFCVGYLKLHLSGVFLSWIISRAVGTLIISYKTPIPIHIFNISKLKAMLHFSFPLCINNLPTILNNSVDRFIIAKFLGLSFVGFYGAAYTFTSFVTIFISALSMTILPIIYKEHKNKEKEIGQLFLVILSSLLCIPIIFSLFNKDIISIVLANEFTSILGKNPLIIFLMLAIIIKALKDFFPGILSARKTWFLSIISLTTLTINIILNILLVPTVGILGAAIATFIATLIGTLIYITISRKYISIPILKKEFTLVTLLSVILMSIFFIINNLLNGTILFSLTIKTFLILILGGVLIFYFKSTLKKVLIKIKH